MDKKAILKNVGNNDITFHANSESDPKDRFFIQFKENRGRPLKYSWPKDTTEQLSINVPTKKRMVSARMAAYLYAKRHGLKYRTWMSEGKLIVECVA